MRSQRFFRSRSIHTNIAVSFSLLILCTTIVLSYTSYRLSSAAVKGNSVAYTSQLIEQVKLNIENYIGNMESIAALVLTSSDLEKYIKGSKLDEEEALKNKLLASHYLRSVVQSRSDISSILYAGSDGMTVSDRQHAILKPLPELIAQDWYQKAMNQLDVAVSSSHVQHIFQDEYRWVVSISRKLTNANAMTEADQQGVLLVDLNYSVINNLCKQIELGKRGYVFIVDPAGSLVYHPQQQLIYSQLKFEQLETVLGIKNGSVTVNTGNDQKLYTVDTTSFGWKIVGVTYPDDLVANKQRMQGTAALWGAISLIFAMAISIFLSYALTKPLKNLELNMKKAERGEFDIRVEIESTNEIGKLARTFNLMIMKIKELMGQIVLEQEMKRVSELKALQAQIKPHFLYNTLDSIIWMAETGKMEEVVEMTSSLSKLLRSTIGEGEELIPLAKELEHIRHYLTIQNMRYRNKFTYSIEVQEDILTCSILKMVLQPLVENAIYHGIKHNPEQGHILIRARQEQNDIIVQIIDDGIGMDEEQMGKVLLQKSDFKTGSGVGVANVNHRVQLYFGVKYGLSFASEMEEGTTATLRIPVIYEEESQ
ncbi:cache domain-containing sensor histidine kinase [Paenibacillus sp. FSL L8-0506]|uniref:cache domain-containing sensor histidine kinase n=1 Tax=Paenibacillus sp. FSL L8-0506 TaxID=2975335 RepID=UPI0030FB3B10